MTPPDRPRLLIIAGPNGSGKTTVTERGLAHRWFQGCEYINPDLIARDVFGDWNSDDAVLSAAREASRRRHQCLADGRSLAFETVFSAPEKVSYVRAAVRAGYFVRLFFIATEDPAINAFRVAHRIMEGGHGVPIEKIVSRYVGSIVNCAKVANEVDRLYLYDNSEEYADPLLTLRARDGRIAREYCEPREWMAPIVSALAPRTP
jgi:predicted ABC-type ATPase